LSCWRCCRRSAASCLWSVDQRSEPRSLSIEAVSGQTQRSSPGPWQRLLLGQSGHELANKTGWPGRKCRVSPGNFAPSTGSREAVARLPLPSPPPPSVHPPRRPTISESATDSSVPDRA
jgi:hypothetical protein